MNEDSTGPICLPVYLDNLATTAVDERVLAAMLPYFRTHYGNASNRGHALGAVAASAVESARRSVGNLLGADAESIVFTSGATESINLALQGVAAAKGHGRIVTVAGEHKATVDTLASLARQGFAVVTVPVNRDGRVEPADVEKALGADTILLTCLHGNNEVGTLQPIAELGALARARGILFHVDAAQTAGKLPLHVDTLHIDLLSISAHKFYGPKGVGALYVRRAAPRARLRPMIHGGGQERGLRSGTSNVPGIVGLGVAADIAQASMPEESARVARLRDRLAARLSAHIPDLVWNGAPGPQRLPGNLHVSVPGIEGRALVEGLREVALSLGAACAGDETSHVLAAMGVDEPLARASLRFGLGRYTTEAEVDFAAGQVATRVKGLRGTL